MQNENSIDMLERYTDWLSRRDLSPNTERAYISRVTQFLSFVARHNRQESLSKSNNGDIALLLDDYRSYLKEQLHMPPASVNSAWTAIQQFLDHHRVHRPQIQREREVRTPAGVLTIGEQQSLLRELESFPLSKHRAVVATFLLTGLRLGECSALDVDDLELTEPFAVVHAFSNGKKRDVPIDSYLQSVYSQWLLERTAYYRPKSSALFINRDGERITNGGLDRIVRTAGYRAGLVLSARLLRRTYIKNMIDDTGDVRQVSALAGIKKVSTLSSWQRHFHQVEMPGLLAME